MAGEPETSLPTPDQLARKIAGKMPLHLLRRRNLLNELAQRWCERHRVWHGGGHLLRLVDRVNESARPAHREVLLLTALYHDAIYDPRRVDNEEASAALLRAQAKDPNDRVVRKAIDLIVASKWTEVPTDGLGRQFWEMDCESLSPDYPLGARLDYERAIFREYQWAAWPIYRSKRAEFLEGWARRFPQQKRGVEACVELLHALHPRVAVYPGSFNPFHHGHLSTLRQAEKVFDKVIIGLAVNRQKPGAEEMLAKRSAELQERLRFHEVATIPGLLTHYLDESELPVSVVRGVRDGTDLEAELRYARFLDELRPGTNAVWIGCAPELQHLSSSAIRELESIDQGAGRRYVPDTREIYRLVV
jgi:pantetheine-phosphate adenylyltransferase